MIAQKSTLCYLRIRRIVLEGGREACVRRRKEGLVHVPRRYFHQAGMMITTREVVPHNIASSADNAYDAGQ